MELSQLSLLVSDQENWVLRNLDPFGDLKTLVHDQPVTAEVMNSPDLALMLAEIACYTTLEKAVELLTEINLVAPAFAGDLALCLKSNHEKLTPAQTATLERLKLLGRVRYFQRLFNDRRREVMRALIR